MRQITHSEEISEYATALAKARKNFLPIQKTSDADAVKYQYKFADLSMVYDATVGFLADEGLSHIQSLTTDEEGTFITTIILHSSGQWFSIPGMKVVTEATRWDEDNRPFQVPLEPQGLGISTTYARRYSFLAAVGAFPCNEDNDGDLGDKKTTPTNAPKSEPKASPQGNQSTTVAAAANAAEETVRSTFHAGAKEAGWGLTDIKAFLTNKFSEFRSNKLSTEQLTEALDYIKAHKPNEITNDNPAPDDDLPAAI